MTDQNANPPAAPAKARVNKWLAAGLILSVAVNLGVGGFAVARHMKFRNMEARGAQGFEEQVARRLPGPAAEAFRKAFGEHRPDRSERMFLRQELSAALAVEPYDSARVATVLAEQSRRLDDLRKGMQAGLLAAADAMTPEERRKFAERLERHGHRGDRPPR